ncbi:MAG: tetratricopeptide repeat protein [candidate division Zixibacteria bacterium]|nr:tetratricopeptide repeat protein [candidate division Zixibacteria bacterium]
MSECIDKNIGKERDRYLLDLLSDKDTDLFEQHLIECEYCASEVESFTETSAHLLHSKTIQTEVAKLVESDETNDSNEAMSTPTIVKSRWWTNKIVWSTAALFVILLFKPWNIEIAPDKTAIAGANRIAILPISSNESANQWLGNAATKLLSTNLSESNQLTILTTQHVSDIIEYLDMQKIEEFDADLALRVAEKAKANWVIIGNIDQSDPKLAINVIMLNTSTGDTVTNEYLTGKATNDLFSIIDKMTDSVKTDILPDTDIDQNNILSVSDITTRSPEAYRNYLHGIDYYEQFSIAEAESCFLNAISYDSTFAMAYYYLAYFADTIHINNAIKYINNSSRQEQYYIKALAFLLKDNTDSFFSEMDNLIKSYPYDARAYYWYARIQSRIRNNQKALDYYYRTIRIDPYHKLAYNNMCYIFIDLGDYKNALWANDMYTAICPDEPNPYDTRGDIYTEMGEFENAIESYLKAMEIRPFFSFTYSKLGVMYQLIRDFDRARHWEYSGWANEHDDPFPANISANMFVAEGKFEKAIETLDEALSLVDQGIMTSVNAESIILTKANILIEKEPQLAYQELETISKSVDSLSDFRQIDYYLLNTGLLNQLGHAAKADSCLEQFKQDIDTTTLNQYRYYYISGYINIQRKQYEEAVLHLRTASDKIGPNHDFESRYLLAVAYVEFKQYADAISELKKQLKNQNYRRTDFPIWNAKMHYYLGRAYEGLGQYRLAIEQYTYFVEIWKDADWDIKEINDAKSRLTYLNNAS